MDRRARTKDLPMKKMLSLVFVASAFLSACEKDDSCAQLARQICQEGKLDCARTITWLDGQMTGPDDKPLDAAQRDAACKMLLGEKEALAGYREQARRDLAAGPKPEAGPGTASTAGTPAATTPTRGADAGAADAAGAIADAIGDEDETGDEEGTGDVEAAGTGEFAEPGGHFTVAFGSVPTVEERTARSVYGTVRLKTFTAADGDARMVVSMGAVTLKSKRLDVGRLLAQVRDENLAGFKIARKEEHPFETSGLPALSVSYLGASGTIEVRGVMRIFVRREPLTTYVVHAVAPPATDEVSLRLFAESFAPAETVSGMDEVLARTRGAADAAEARARATELEAARREAERRAEADRSDTLGGAGSYRWSSVRTNGPSACVFFAGPVSRASRRSYTGGSGTWTLSGRRARFELGGAVDFRGTVRNRRVSVRNVERATLDGAPYTFTETITGKLDASGRFRGTYRYSDCRTDGSERCPGPCTIRATLTGSP